MVTVSYSNITETSFIAQITGLTTGETSVDKVCYWLLNGTSKGSTTVNKYTSSSSFTFTGLSPNTSYTVVVNVNRASDGVFLDSFGNITVTTLAPTKVKPSRWVWTSTFTVGQPINITAKEFNDFLDAINDLRDYYDLSKQTFTKVTPNTTMYASQVKQAIDILNTMIGYQSIAPVSQGDPIKASLFTDLANTYNAIRGT